jgi:hypothetical protein
VHPELMQTGPKKKKKKKKKNHACLYISVPASAMYYTGLVNCLVTKLTTIFIVTLANIFTVVTVRGLVLHNPS